MTDMNTLNDLKSFLSEDQIKSDSPARQQYGKDWTTYFDINASAILFPKNTEQVQKIVLWAIKHKIALVPSGGRTGLSGAACALNGEVVVSFDKMNQIFDFNPWNQTVGVQAGVITENLQKYAEDQGLFYPVDFAARGSSQIGGNIATNAGGIKVVRYGLTRDWVVGLKVVTGTGEILNLNNSLIKNATGYDLRHLMIGSEGTLGFITEATIKLAPAPAPSKVLLLALENLENVMNIFSQFQKHTSVVAYEMFSELALTKVLESTSLPRPFQSPYSFYVITEIECANEAEEQKILDVFEQGLEKQWILDGQISQSAPQSKNFWRYREDISESLSRYSPYKNDISVSISKVPAFIKELDTILKSAYPQWEVVWFGHIGDGNLHINILRPVGMSKEDFVKECQKVDHLIFSCIEKFQGSISAEHGVGLTKKKFLHHTRSMAEIEILKGIKKVFDPHAILNPGKLF